VYLPPAERVSRLEAFFLEDPDDHEVTSNLLPRLFRRKTAARSRRVTDEDTGDGDSSDDISSPESKARLDRVGAFQEHLQRFIQETDRAIDLLSPVLPEIASLDDQDTLTYLHACVSTKRHPVSVPDIPTYLDAFLSDEPLTGGLSPAIGQPPAHRNRSWVSDRYVSGCARRSEPARHCLSLDDALLAARQDAG
jgi:hypothetical protein